MSAPFPPIEPAGGSALWARNLRTRIAAADTEPAPAGEPWNADDIDGAGDAGDVVGLGGRLDPLSVLTAYRHGVFPMGLGDGGGVPMGWWCPRWRGVLLPGQLHISRSLRRSLPRFRVTVDEAFDEVVAACGAPERQGSWITDAIAEVYSELHALGWAHSIEVRDGTGLLVGGLYGIAVGGLFAGESMFHHVTDASKAAMVHLDRIVSADGDERRIIDVQWRTPHLGTMGVIEIHRQEYLARLAEALQASDLDVGGLA